MGVQNADSKNEAFSNTVLRSDPCLSIGYGSGQYLVGNYWAPSKGDRDGAYRWFGNKYIVAGITGGMCFIADLMAHPSHFGGVSTEAIVTGAFTALISLVVNFVGKRLFVHGRSKLTKS